MRKTLLLLIIVLVLPSITFAQRSGSFGSKTSTYQLTVNANVKSYSVLIDGQAIKGNRATVDSGNHTVTVRANGYYDWQQNVNVSSNQTITANLQPEQYQLSINANVSGYTVLIDGQGIKGNRATVDPGNHTVTVRANGYFDWQQNVNVSSNQTITANLQPEQYQLSIESNISGAEVYIDGNSRGNVRFTDDLRPGRYNIRVSEYGYRDFTTTVNLNQNQQIYANLEPAYARIQVKFNSSILNPKDKGASGKVEIYVDGNPQNGRSFQLMPGQHTIRIVSGGFSVEETFNFQPDQNYTIEPSFSLSIE